MENQKETNGKAEKQPEKEIIKRGDIDKVGGPIELEKARKWTQNYRRTHEKDTTTSHLFGRDVIEKILKQSDCKGIRIHYSVDDLGKKQLVLCGVNHLGEDQLPKRNQSQKYGAAPQALEAQPLTVGQDDYALYDQSWPCPGTSGCPTNDLTSN